MCTHYFTQPHLLPCWLLSYKLVFKASCGELVYLKPQERGAGTACHKLEQFALFLIREAFHNSPEDSDYGVISRIAAYDKRNRRLY